MSKQAPLQPSVRRLIWGTVIFVIVAGIVACILLKPTPAHGQEIAREPPVTITIQCSTENKACAAFTARVQSFANNHPDIKVVAKLSETLTDIPIVSIAVYSELRWKSDSKDTRWTVHNDGRGTLLRATIRKARRALMSLKGGWATQTPCYFRPMITSTGGLFYTKNSAPKSRVSLILIIFSFSAF